VWGRYLQKSLPGTTIMGPVIHSIDARSASINHAVLTPYFRQVLMARHAGFGAADVGRGWLVGLGAVPLGDGLDEFGELACRFRSPDGYEWLGLPAV
jgi:hypothetical protein